MANWYFSTGGKAQGPVDESDVLEALKSERLNLVDLVFEEGSAAWLTIGEVAQFRDAFHAFKRAQTEEVERQAAAEITRLKKEADARAEAQAREMAKTAGANQLAGQGASPLAGQTVNQGHDSTVDRKKAQQAKLQEAVAQTAKVSKSLQPQSIAALSAADEWVILRKSGEQFEQIGPFTREFVLAKLGTGEIEYSQYAWKPGFQRWVRIGNLAEFDRRRPDRDAADLAKIIATVPTPSWEQEAMRTKSPSFDDLQTSVLQFDPPLNQIKKEVARELPPEDAKGEDLLGSVTSPGFKQIGQSDEDASEMNAGAFHEELTPIPEEFQQPVKREAAARNESPAHSAPVKSMIDSLPPLVGSKKISASPEEVAEKISQQKASKSESVPTQVAEQKSDWGEDSSRPFDELTQPSFHSVEGEMNDETTGDFSKYLGTKPLLDQKAGGPPETISRRADGPQDATSRRTDGPPPLKKNSKLDEKEAVAAPPPVIEDIEKTRIESSYSISNSQSFSGVTSPTLVEQQASLLASETVVGVSLSKTAPDLSAASLSSAASAAMHSNSPSAAIPPVPENEFNEKPLPGRESLNGLVSLQPPKVEREVSAMRESSFVAGSLREALSKSQSPSQEPKLELESPSAVKSGLSGDSRAQVSASSFDDQATVVGASIARPAVTGGVVASSVSARGNQGVLPGDPQSGVFKVGKSSDVPNVVDQSKSVYEEMSDGRTIVQPVPSSRARESNKPSESERSHRANAESASLKAVPSHAPSNVSKDEFDSPSPESHDEDLDRVSEKRSGSGQSRGVRKKRREKPTSAVVKFTRLFIAGLIIGLVGLYGYHVYTTHQLGLTPHLAGQDEEEVQGPPDVTAPGDHGAGSGSGRAADQKDQKAVAPTAQSGRPSGTSPSAMIPPPPPPESGSTQALNAPPPPPSGGAIANTKMDSVNPSSGASANVLPNSKLASKSATESTDEDDAAEVVEAPKGPKSPLALGSLSGVRQVQPAAKVSTLEVLPYRLTSETPLLLLQTNAPIGERMMVRIRGRSGEILKYRSYTKVLKVTRNATEYPGVDLSKLKLPTGSYKIEAVAGDLKKTAQVFVGVRDSKFGQETEHHLKEISFAQQREKKSMFFAAKTFENLAQSLNENFDKLHAQSGAWRTFLRGWNRQVSQARAPIASIISDRRNYPMAYPEEMQGLAKMVTQLSAEARELDSAVQQKRDVASQSTAELAKEFTRIKQEIAMISSRRSP